MIVEQPSIVLFAGPSGVGKSTLAKRVFGDAVISSDETRRMLFGHPGVQRRHDLVFGLVREVVSARIQAGGVAVVDATMLTAKERKPFVDIARSEGVPIHLIVLHATKQECMQGQAGREVVVPESAINRHMARLQNLMADHKAGALEREGYASVRVIDRAGASALEVGVVNRRAELVDVIGDVHGCRDELIELAGNLGYTLDGDVLHHPEGRQLAFLGDLTDRGPEALGVLRIVAASRRAGTAFLASVGNHDSKLWRYYHNRTKNMQITHGLDETIAQLKAADAETEAAQIIAELIADSAAFTRCGDGSLLIAHAALPVAALAGTVPARERSEVGQLTMYGQTTGIDELTGLPIRVYDWVSDWEGLPYTVIVGHDVIGPQPLVHREWDGGKVLGIDTGCCFGGALTAYRYPEGELHSVPSRQALRDDAPASLRS